MGHCDAGCFVSLPHLPLSVWKWTSGGEGSMLYCWIHCAARFGVSLHEDTGMLGIPQCMWSHNTDVRCTSLSQQPSATCLQSWHAADTTLLSPNWPVQPCLNSCPAPDTVLLLVLLSRPAKPLFSLVPTGSRHCESCSGVKQHNNQFSSVCTCLK